MKPWKRVFCSPSISRPRAAATAAAILLACAGSVPEPGEGHARWAEGHGIPGRPEALREGRRLFVMKCDGCHDLPRIRDYAPEDWPSWMDSMRVEFRNADAELPPRDDSLIRNYLIVVSGHWRDSTGMKTKPATP